MHLTYKMEQEQQKRYLTKRAYAAAVPIGIGSLTKAISKEWVDVCEFPSIDGEFIDTEQYPIENYFSHIAVCQKNKREKKSH